MKRLLCLACQAIVEVLPEAPVSCCPNCGDRGIPADADDLATVKITWHELRVLVMWAEFWANKLQPDEEQKKGMRVVYGIADRLQAQHLERPALTFRGELSDLRSHFGNDVEVHGFREDIEP